MVSGELIREARLRAGLTQTELGERIGQPQSVVARWERGAVIPSFETLRRAIRGCDLELSFHLSRLDESTPLIIDEHLRMTSAERFADLLERVRFHDQLQNGKSESAGV
ncbi:MAG: helix-turn-helix transcriptional regulator [Acidimicrobiales bacterium]|jgi:transcriptional regulator with XRE-family HTH domain